MRDDLDDPETLGALIGLVYESALGSPRWQALLDRISGLFPGVACHIVPYGEDSFLPPIAETHGTPVVPGGADFNRARLPRRTDRPILRTPPGHVGRTIVDFDEADWLRTTVYQAFLAPAGCRHVVSVNLGELDGRSVMLSCAIPEEAGRHALIHNPLCLLVTRLAPHLVRATALVSERARSVQRAALTASALDALSMPMLVTDALGAVHFANAAARATIAEDGPLGLSQAGHLIEANGEGLLRQGLEEADVTGRSIAVSLRTAERAYWCCIVPMREKALSTSGNPSLFAVYPGYPASERPATDLAVRVFGLSQREAEICADMALGLTPKEIAAQAGRSLKTVRNQINAIHEKMGVSTSGEVVEIMSMFRTLAPASSPGS